MQRARKSGFRVFFNGVSVLVFFSLFYNSPFGHQTRVIHGRVLQETHESSLNESNNNDGMKLMGAQICAELLEHKGFMSHCDYLLAHPDCASGGFFNYIKFFYCDCKNYRPIGYLVLGVWLVILFYLLGNTAADYFCCSLEKLSDLLKMSPTVAGVTLLPLGNGAPDVFASIAAFAGSGSDDVGFNSIMGGAVFITCVVVGVVSFCVAHKRVRIDRKCFIRDLCFFLFTVVCLALILVVGKVNTLGAMAFVSIYIVYAIFVALNEILGENGWNSKVGGLTPLIPMAEGFSSYSHEGSESMYVPLLSPDNYENPSDLSAKLPHWMWNNNVSIYSDYIKANMEDSPSPRWGWSDDRAMNEESPFSCSKLCSLLEMPLNFPRRLTIPIVEEDRWSKIYAVSSAFLAPLLLAFLWNTRENIGPLSLIITYVIGFGTGSILGILAFLYTSNEHPPHRCLLPWVLGGFFMSIIWFYIIADELVSLLVSFGVILGISPSILALTFLAWGNSMGDLMSNTALAMNERNGVQIAMSGCYAGPMFNTLIGLGVSLLIGAWSMGSEPYVVPRDGSLLITLGFLAAALIWALIVLPLSDMRPNKILAVGLITIYLMFLSVRVGTALS